ncbi:response regulator [Fulvimarina sp. 2208YS6-2-32]|uniref:Response regulator n=1 Tax=Fulvimarina uroteuthidis TaxID=3098149 RepID=A0ABU5I321_9HYPH|nr:response regulator [Fulvimarina sp. 2208YS6-2-32]MDY8109368.1 response regulator [Fulvimarina sp. 2208YS6-2-32]
MMRILILEDEPIIAIDLEDTVRDRCDADVCLADSVAEAEAHLKRGAFDFALLDVRLKGRGETSLAIAQRLARDKVPFCFVSSAIDPLPPHFQNVPHVTKPFELSQLEAVLP